MNPIPTVLDPAELLDKAFSKARRLRVRDPNPLYRAKKLAISQVHSVGDVLRDSLKRYVEAFPSFDQIHPFYVELVEADIGVDAAKKALSSVQWAAEKVTEICAKATRQIARMGRIDVVAAKRREVYGRLSSVVREIGPDLAVLASLREALKLMPELDPDRPTVVIAGPPNVGKSALVGALSTAKPRVDSYPFTTHEVSVGHAEFGGRRWQVIDTPGLLDRPSADRNEIERKAAAALTRIRAVTVFLLDPSGSCGMPYADQECLVESLRGEVAGPVVIVDGKADLARGRHTLRVSAVTGEGLSALMEAVEAESVRLPTPATVRERERLEATVLDRVRPSTDEAAAVRETAEALCAAVVLEAKALGLGYEVVPFVGGSVAKGTELRGGDVDLFLLFPPEVPKDALESVGLTLARAVLDNPVENYAEHPYLRGTFRGVLFEVVPAFRIEDPSGRRSAVDRSPLHARWVISRVDGLRDDIRLAKAFMKGIGVYGAEQAVRGFSGYLVECLVISMGGFGQLLTWGAFAVPGARVVPPGAEDRLEKPAPLLVPDPTDPERNVAAAVSEEALTTFREACRAYLAAPSIAFFFPDPPRALPHRSLENRVSRLGTLVGARLEIASDNPDTAHGQARRSLTGMADQLLAEGFEVIHSGYFVSTLEGGKTSVLFLFLLKPDRLEPEHIHEGPPSGSDRVAHFLAKWRGHPDAVAPPFEEDGRWRVRVRRPFTDPLSYLARAAMRARHGKAVRARLDSMRFMDGAELVRDSPTEVTELVARRRPWERSSR